MSWPYPPEPALATDRFTMIVTALVGYIRTKAKPGTLWSVVYLAAARVTRLQRRFERLVVRYRAGTLLPPRPRAPRPEKELPEMDAQEMDAQETDAEAQADAKPEKPARPISLLPRRFGWLCGIVPLWAAAYGGKILYLLNDQEMRDLIAAAPQAGRLLRPLLWMTGRQIPPFLALPKRVRKPRAQVAAQPDDPVPPAPSGSAAAREAAPKSPPQRETTGGSRPAPPPIARAEIFRD